MSRCSLHTYDCRTVKVRLLLARMAVAVSPVFLSGCVCVPIPVSRNVARRGNPAGKAGSRCNRSGGDYEA